MTNLVQEIKQMIIDVLVLEDMSIDDIDENAMVLCEDFDITDDVCRDCWKMNGGRK